MSMIRRIRNYFDSSLVDAVTFKLRMINLRSTISIILSIICPKNYDIFRKYERDGRS